MFQIGQRILAPAHGLIASYLPGHFRSLRMDPVLVAKCMALRSSDSARG